MAWPRLNQRVVLAPNHPDAGRHGRVIQVAKDMVHVRLDGHGREVFVQDEGQWRDETRADVDADEARRCMLPEDEEVDEGEEEYWKQGGDNLADDDESSMGDEP